MKETGLSPTVVWPPTPTGPTGRLPQVSRPGSQTCRGPEWQGFCLGPSLKPAPSCAVAPPDLPGERFPLPVALLSPWGA